MRRAFQIDQPLCESGTLQVARYGGKYCQHTDNAIVARRKQTSEYDAEDEVEYLRRSAVQSTPEETFGSALFQ